MTRSHLNPDGTRYHTLTVACAEPLTCNELLDRLAMKGFFPPEVTLKEAVRRLIERGFLAPTIPNLPPHTAQRYILTAQGEAELDYHWQERAA